MHGERLAAELLDSSAPLGQRFESAAARARQQYPYIRVELSQFACHVAAVCLTQTSDLAGTLDSLHLEDLYLAHACSRGDRNALRHFEVEYLQPLRTQLPEFDRCAPKLDELKQQLRERLLMGRADAPPRIARYGGRGRLGAWLQVAAQRLALTALRRRGQVHAGDDAIGAEVASSTDTELSLLRLRHAETFRAAMARALAEATPRERLLLRLHIVDGVSLTRIAASYHVSQSTASRWFLAARERLRLAMAEHLRETLGLEASQLESFVAAFQSRLDLSLSRLLKPDAAAGSHGDAQ